MKDMVIDKALLDWLFEQAEKSERKRMNYDMRTSAEDGSQRMLNALLPGTQVPIHRHLETAETVVVLSGRMTEIFYDEQGAESARYDIDPAKGRFALQIPKGVWHTLVAEVPCVIFEAKDGAYRPLTEDEVWK